MTSAQIRQGFLDFFRSKQHSIVPSSSLLPDSPNLLFTNAGMNQFVPIFLGEKKCPYSPGRAADTQKCIRAGGKHNDLEDVGLDTYHHTFFEMLGNWSFGDYFKPEAIAWAWELITQIWKFPPARLYATVYAPDKSKGDPADFDQEAYDAWAEKFRSVGLDPAVHIVNGNKKDNFWMMGETGPCGPCTELHVDLTPAGDTAGTLVNKGVPQCIEIWNLVFIQFNANADGTFTPLPARHVDTGMGFERVTSILQCTNNFQRFDGVISNYETDIFRPIFDALEKLSGKRYGSTLPKNPTRPAPGQESLDVAFRVIADHIRTLSFAIADGINPGNNDRNYVLRRILRRAVRYGRTLGLHEPFFHKLVDVLAETMGDVFPEIRARAAHTRENIRIEEEAFNKTLDRGMELFEAEVAHLSPDASSSAQTLSGEFVFKLYDTYGFPLDLTELLARERGLSVDTARFGELMHEQRERAKAAQKREVIEVTTLATQSPTNFTGHETLSAADAKILEVATLKGGIHAVITDTTPFYAEMGGQVGDSGSISTADGRSWKISGTRKIGDVFLHILDVAAGENLPAAGQTASLQVERPRRLAIERHHTVTHLLHWALHQIVSGDISQKGSSVNESKLTFDFNSAALTSAQVHAVEALVNEKIRENSPVSTTQVAHASIKDRADIMQFFGDKYGETVRVVQIGGEKSALNGYSMELCGGTHVRATGEIGAFRILSENAIAAGVRRIEALAGEPAIAHARVEADRLAVIAHKLGVSAADIDSRLAAMFEQNFAQIHKLRQFLQREQDALATSLVETQVKIAENGQRLLVVTLCKEKISFDTPAELRDFANKFAKRVDVAILGAEIAGKASVVCQCSPVAVAAGRNAGKIISAICATLGGKGGGKPDSAMGGGSPENLAPTLADFANTL